MRINCIEKFISVMYTIISKKHKYLSIFSLKILSYYINWIDIKLIFNEKYLTLFFQLLSEEEFRISSVTCIISIIKKGIVSEDKIKMFQNLQIIKILNFFDVKDLEFSKTLSELANQYGLELLTIYFELLNENNELYNKAFEKINELLPIIFKMYSMIGN
jgi:hypothetical protein